MHPRDTPVELSNKTGELNDVEKVLLSKGPKFAVAAGLNDNTVEACKTTFACFTYQFRWGTACNFTAEQRSSNNNGGNEGFPNFPKSTEANVPPSNNDIDAKLKRIHHAVASVVRSLPKREKWTNLPRPQREALQELRKKPYALMPSDKDGEFCAMNKEEYTQLGRSYLSDAEVYEVVQRMTAKTVEGKINSQWRKIARARGVLWRCEKSSITNKTRLATFHHLVKTQKPGPQLGIRAIVANRGGPTERVSWLLSTLLSPLLSTVPTHMPDSGHLMTAVAGTSPAILQQHRFQVSLNVVSLYTSVPIEDALIVVRDKLLQEAATPSPLQTVDLVTLLKTTLNLTYFTYAGRIYKQKTSLPMGCSVSGMVAILFLERIERRALSLFARCPLFLGYVDDCYALVASEEKAKELHNVMND